MVDSFLQEIDDYPLMAKSETFNTLIHVVTTIEQLQNLEEIQPGLAWKPLEVIKKTLEATPHWG